MTYDIMTYDVMKCDFMTFDIMKYGVMCHDVRSDGVKNEETKTVPDPSLHNLGCVCWKHNLEMLKTHQKEDTTPRSQPIL